MTVSSCLLVAKLPSVLSPNNWKEVIRIITTFEFLLSVTTKLDSVAFIAEM